MPCRRSHKTAPIIEFVVGDRRNFSKDTNAVAFRVLGS